MIIFNNSDFVARTNAILGRVNASLGLVGQDAGQAVVMMTEPRTPIESGTLRSSGTITAGSGAVGFVEVLVEFSAYNPRSGYPYGELQHEHPFNHPRGGEDHFLLNTIMEQSGVIVTLMSSQMAAAIG
jgi:hypothetical protein